MADRCHHDEDAYQRLEAIYRFCSVCGDVMWRDSAECSMDADGRTFRRDIAALRCGCGEVHVDYVSLSDFQSDVMQHLLVMGRVTGT